MNTRWSLHPFQPALHASRIHDRKGLCIEPCRLLGLTPLQSLSLSRLPSFSHLSVCSDHDGMFAFSDDHSILSLLIWFDITFLNPEWHRWTPLRGLSRKSYHVNTSFFPGFVKLVNTSPSECSSTCLKAAIRHIGTQISKETVTHGHFLTYLFFFFPF